jgi:hypothetical protein
MFRNTEQYLLEKQATAILARAGCAASGLPKGEGGKSVKTILTPCGGQPGWKR